MTKAMAGVLLFFYLIFAPPSKTAADVVKNTDLTEKPIGIDNMTYLSNKVRRGFDCGNDLVENEKLEGVAQQRAEYLEKTGEFSHKGFIPTVRKYYSYSRAGENLVRGFHDDEAAMLAWVTSKGHRENILNCDYTETGIGRADDTIVQIFGTPQEDR